VLVLENFLNSARLAFLSAAPPSSPSLSDLPWMVIAKKREKGWLEWTLNQRKLILKITPQTKAGVMLSNLDII